MPDGATAPAAIIVIVSPLDPTTFGTETPRTLDGRSYPDHLRPYEAYDEQLLPLFDSAHPVTFDDVSYRIGNPRLRSVLPRWLASAEWRGLVQRIDASMHGPREYALGPEGLRRLG